MKSWKANLEKTRKRRRKHEVARHRPPAGSRPGTLVVPPDAAPTRIRVVRFEADALVEREIRSAAELDDFCRSEGLFWVDVQGLGDRAALEWLGKTFELHPLLLADVVNAPQRPKAEAYGDTVFFVARRLVWKGDAVDPVDERQVSFVLGARHVLSFQQGPDEVFEPVRARLAEGGTRMRTSGPDYLLYALLDRVIDDYLPILDRLGECLESLEERVLARPTRALMIELSAVRHDLLAIRRDTWPTREALHALLRGDVGRIGEPTKLYLRDVHDHVVQVAELVEIYREIAAGLLNLYMTAIANRTNEVMKVLTVMATIFIPLTFLVGVWGMNFDHMPELHWRYGYLAVWLLMIGIAAALFAYFRRRGWIGREPD